MKEFLSTRKNTLADIQRSVEAYVDGVGDMAFLEDLKKVRAHRNDMVTLCIDAVNACDAANKNPDDAMLLRRAKALSAASAHLSYDDTTKIAVDAHNKKAGVVTPRQFKSEQLAGMVSMAKEQINAEASEALLDATHRYIRYSFKNGDGEAATQVIHEVAKSDTKASRSTLVTTAASVTIAGAILVGSLSPAAAQASEVPITASQVESIPAIFSPTPETTDVGLRETIVVDEAPSEQGRATVIMNTTTSDQAETTPSHEPKPYVITDPDPEVVETDIEPKEETETPERDIEIGKAATAPAEAPPVITSDTPETETAPMTPSPEAESEEAPQESATPDDAPEEVAPEEQAEKELTDAEKLAELAAEIKHRELNELAEKIKKERAAAEEAGRQWNAKDMPDAVAIMADLKEKYDNVSGKLSDDELSAVDAELWGKHRLQADAAAGLRALNEAFAKKFGEAIAFTDSYRSYEQQVELKKEKPTLAATPGTSNHGWGFAVDFASDINKFGSEERQWMMDNAAQFGFVSPEWAREFDENGVANKPEPWHWEYIGIAALDVNYDKQQKPDTKAEAKPETNDDKKDKESDSNETKIGNVTIEAAERMAELDGVMGRAGKIMLELLSETDFTPGQAAGFIGNPMVESPGLIASQKQYSGGPGRGLVQWEIGFYKDGQQKRGQDLLDFAKARGTTWDDFDTQVAFMVHELKGKEKRAYGKIRTAKVVSEAAVLTRTFYERPSVHHDQRRIDAGLDVYVKYDKIRKQVQAEKDKQEGESNKPSSENLAVYENEKFSPGNEKAAETAVARAFYYTEHLDEVTAKCSGKVNCKGMCGRVSGVVYGYATSGFMTAKLQFKDAKQKGISYNVNVAKGEAPHIGDLIYYEATPANGNAGHVAIYVGDGKIIGNVSHEEAYRAMTLQEAENLYGKNIGAAPGTNFKGGKDKNAITPPKKYSVASHDVVPMSGEQKETPVESGEVLPPRHDEGAEGLLVIDHHDTTPDEVAANQQLAREEDAETKKQAQQQHEKQVREQAEKARQQAQEKRKADAMIDAELEKLAHDIEVDRQFEQLKREFAKGK